MSSQGSHWNFEGITLNLWNTSGNVVISIQWILPTQEHSGRPRYLVFVHLLPQVGTFSLCRPLPPWLCFYPFSSSIVDGVIFLISFLANSVLLHKKADLVSCHCTDRVDRWSSSLLESTGSFKDIIFQVGIVLASSLLHPCSSGKLCVVVCILFVCVICTCVLVLLLEIPAS